MGEMEWGGVIIVNVAPFRLSIRTKHTLFFIVASENCLKKQISVIVIE